MRPIPLIAGLLLTAALIFLLDNKWGPVPPAGRFLSPQQGFWQNAEPADADHGGQLQVAGLKGPVNVYFDSLLIPHVFAEQEEDVYFVQGYLHAKFRLWQMEFQTRAAAGRISEVLGENPNFLRFDREQRRLGLSFAAERVVVEIERDPLSKRYMSAYSKGVNAYIGSLTEASLPIEYKLLDYKPEPWSNLKIALFLKQMSKNLAGFDRDLELTNARSLFSHESLDLLFPQLSDSSRPIIPAGSSFPEPKVRPVPPKGADSAYFRNDTVVRAKEAFRPDRKNGSNNWALAGSRTASGAPLLANDPHLGLSLPSIWYEMQLHTPTMNTYGATFPGSPSVIIGFNESIAFGVTNAGRDVKDYYTVRFRDLSRKEYWYNGAWTPAEHRVETISVRDAAPYKDTVAYTVWGPVLYDHTFVSDSASPQALALRWTAHDPSNEGLMWFKLNRASTLEEYEELIRPFGTPGQNILFASKRGDIAIWQQGRFPARWEGQGMYIMPGEDSSYAWQGFIPQDENPHIANPVSGYIQSANQRPVDSTYPYYIPGHYVAARGIRLQQRLEALNGATVQDMMDLQNDYFSPVAAMVLPKILSMVRDSGLNRKERSYLNELRQWNFEAGPGSRATTIYQSWVDSLETLTWNDEFDGLGGFRPDEETLVEALLRDSNYRYFDNVATREVEEPSAVVTAAFRKAAAALEEGGGDELFWWRRKNTSILHLLRSAVLPFGKQGLEVGGWSNTLNAITSDHGPSWRMIVHLTPQTEAYGIYPGGQSGNPGSRFYDNFIADWTAGRYHPLWMMREAESRDPRIRWTLHFTNN